MKEHRKGAFNVMLLNNALTRHLINVNTKAIDFMDTLIRQMAKVEGVTEALKRQDQMEGVQRMNSIRNRAAKIVRNELTAILD